MPGAGHCRDKQTRAFALSDSFSVEAIQMYKRKIILLTLFPSFRVTYGLLAKQFHTNMCEVI